MSSPPNPGHVHADLDPQRTSKTAENIRGYAGKYGEQGMTTTAGELNSHDEVVERREEAIGHHEKKKGMALDEEPPASFRKKGDPFTTKWTSEEKSHRQGGYLAAGEKKARKMGKDTKITHGIKGESLGGPEKKPIEGPAGAAKSRHENKRKPEEKEGEGPG